MAIIIKRWFIENNAIFGKPSLNFKFCSVKGKKDETIIVDVTLLSREKLDVFDHFS